MLSSTLMVTLVFAAPVSELFWGEVPQEVPTYTVTFPDGETLPAGIRRGGEWLTDDSVLQRKAEWLEFVIDTPWTPQPPRNAFLNKLRERVREAPVLRRGRLEKGWEQAGYLFVQTPAGLRPVLKQELVYAERAAAMEEALDAAPDGAAASQEDPLSLEGGGEGPPGLVRQWGGHVAVMVMGLILAGLVLKSLVFGESA